MEYLNDFLSRQKDMRLPVEDAKELLQALTAASLNISKNVNRAGLIDILGAAGAENVQGEEQQKLDVLADKEILKFLSDCEKVCAAASEENEDMIVLNDETGDYVVSFDPLDGSSNIDVNVSIGTIFSVYQRKSQKGQADKNDFLRRGKEQVMAGYIIYGSSTMLVLTTGNGVNAFTLDPDASRYALSHPDIKTPQNGKIYSLNEGNAYSFEEGLNEYLDYCKSADNNLGKAYSARYIGSMVADIHRNLIKGGLFIYPATSSSPNGKLRMLYECQPMAFILEEAGGKASSGTESILDIEITELHQRSPIYIGSANMVNDVLQRINPGIHA